MSSAGNSSQLSLTPLHSLLCHFARAPCKMKQKDADQRSLQNNVFYSQFLSDLLLPVFGRANLTYTVKVKASLATGENTSRKVSFSVCV